MQKTPFRQVASACLVALFSALVIPLDALASSEDALSALNQEFRRAYTEARESALKGSTAIILVGDRMVTFRPDIREEVNYVPAILTHLKSVAHLPLALFVMLYEEAGAPLNRTTLDRLEILDQRTATAQSELPAIFTEVQRERQDQILRASRTFIKDVLCNRTSSSPTAGSVRQTSSIWES